MGVRELKVMTVEGEGRLDPALAHVSCATPEAVSRNSYYPACCVVPCTLSSDTGNLNIRYIALMSCIMTPKWALTHIICPAQVS